MRLKENRALAVADLLGKLAEGAGVGEIDARGRFAGGTVAARDQRPPVRLSQFDGVRVLLPAPGAIQLESVEPADALAQHAVERELVIAVLDALLQPEGMVEDDQRAGDTSELV